MIFNTRQAEFALSDDRKYPLKLRVELATTQRLLFVIVLPPLLLALLISALYLIRLNHPAEVAAQEHGLAILNHLVPTARQSMISRPGDDLNGLLKNAIAQDGVVAATLFDGDGRITASQGHPTLVVSGHLTTIPNILVIAQNNGRLGLLAPLWNVLNTIDSHIPIALVDRVASDVTTPVGWLYVEIDTATIAQWQRSRTNTLLMLVLATLAVTTTAALWLGRSITQTHTAINETINEVTGEFAYQATHDPLTGLPNRRAFEEALEKAVSATRRISDQDSLCFIDLDHFKHVNDTCGHAAGDALLCKVASLIQQRLRAQDLICRFGGDEFALILHGCTNGAARRIADELCAALAELRFEWEGKNYQIGASIGLARIIGPADTPADVLRAADSACYAAKHSGRNCVVEHRDKVVKVK